MFIISGDRHPYVPGTNVPLSLINYADPYLNNRRIPRPDYLITSLYRICFIYRDDDNNSLIYSCISSIL